MNPERNIKFWTAGELYEGGQQGSRMRVHMVRVVYVEYTALLRVCCSCFAACDSRVITSRKNKKSIVSGLVRSMSSFNLDKLTIHPISFERLSVHRDGAQSRMSFLRRCLHIL